MESLLPPWSCFPTPAPSEAFYSQRYTFNPFIVALNVLKQVISCHRSRYSSGATLASLLCYRGTRKRQLLCVVRKLHVTAIRLECWHWRLIPDTLHNHLLTEKLRQIYNFKHLFIFCYKAVYLTIQVFVFALLSELLCRKSMNIWPDLRNLSLTCIELTNRIWLHIGILFSIEKHSEKKKKKKKHQWLTLDIVGGVTRVGHWASLEWP